jgi:prevent-host-death family protein
VRGRSDRQLQLPGTVSRLESLQIPVIAHMTTSSHNKTMRQVRIAELKARLSEYLRAVRRGETIAVLDRDTPVAEIVPVRNRTGLRVRKPAPGVPAPNRIPLQKPLKLDIDVVQLLLEERQGER